jgi:hypothetical protein
MAAASADAAEAAEPARLCLFNVPKYMDKKQLGAFLSSVEGLPPVKSFTKVYQKEMAFVTFEDADAVAAAKPVLAAQQLKGNLLDVQDDTRKKRQRCGDAGEGEERTKKQKLEDNAPDDLGNWLARRLAREAEAASAAASNAEAGAAAAAALRYPRTISDVVTSLWEMEYAEQLKRKQTEMRKVVVKLWRKTRGVYFTKAKDESRQSGKGGRGKRGGRGGRGGGRGKGALSAAGAVAMKSRSEYFSWLRDNFEASGMPLWLKQWHNKGNSDDIDAAAPGGDSAAAQDGAAAADSPHPLSADASGAAEDGNGERSYISIEDSRLDPILYCPLAPVVGAPQLMGYRNKCEMTIGSALDGTPTVGFRMGSWAQGVHVESVEGCFNVSEGMKQLSDRVQTFVRSSPLPPYNLVGHVGTWRALTLRSSTPTGKPPQLMAVVQVNPKGVAADVLIDEFSRLVTMLGDSGLSSLFVQLFDGVSAPAADHPVVLLALNGAVKPAALVQLRTELSAIAPNAADAAAAVVPAAAPAAPAAAADAGTSDAAADVAEDGADGSIEESLLNLRFRISPGAFFQVNTPAAELLYSVVADETMRGDGLGELGGAEGAGAAAPRKITVLDVCCGTGSIGLCIAARGAHRVIGIEVRAAAAAAAAAACFVQRFFWRAVHCKILTTLRPFSHALCCSCATRRRWTLWITQSATALTTACSFALPRRR